MTYSDIFTVSAVFRRNPGLALDAGLAASNPARLDRSKGCPLAFG